MDLQTSQMTGKIGVSGTLVYYDKDGNIVGTAELKGSMPLAQAQELAKEQANDDQRSE